MTMFDYRDALAIMKERRNEVFGKDDFAYGWLTRITVRITAASEEFYAGE